MHSLIFTIFALFAYYIVYYICRHCFSYFVFDLYWRNKKSRNWSSLIMQENSNKKRGCFNWLFQTFKTIKVVVVRSATKFSRAFSYEEQNCFLLVIVKIKTNLKSAWKVSKYGVSLPIQSECRKIRTRNNSVFGHFPRSEAYAVYCALPSNIIKYIRFEYICTFILYCINIHYINLTSFTFILQNDQNGEHIGKIKTYLNMPHIYWIYTSN